MRRHAGWGLILLVLAVALLWPRWQAREQTVALACADIVAGCALPPEHGQVRFDRQPDALQRFRVEVEWPGADEVHASFQMRGMEMGFNRYKLLPAGAGRWRAEVMLPACIQGRKDWLIVLEAEGKSYELPFRSR